MFITRFIILIIFSLMLSQLVKADLLLCEKGIDCKCKDETDTLIPENYSLDSAFGKNSLAYRCEHKAAYSFENEVSENNSATKSILIVPTIDLTFNPQLSCQCDDPKNGIIDWPKQLITICQNFPQGCSYDWKGFNPTIYRKSIKHYIEKNEVLCSESNHSMCTSATFLAFVGILKQMKLADKISQVDFDKFSRVPGDAWNFQNNLARPDLMMTELGLGEGKVLEKTQIPDSAWPIPGDFLQLWRENRSGHSTVFMDYLKDASGKILGVCYWSSQPATNGYGKRCEDIKAITTMQIGRVTK